MISSLLVDRLRENLADTVSSYEIKYYHTQTLPDGTNWRNAI